MRTVKPRHAAGDQLTTRSVGALLVLGAILAAGGTSVGRARPATPRATPAPAVLTFTTIRASVAAAMLRKLYPHISITVDPGANAVIVLARPDQLDALRQIASGIDTKSPLSPVTQSLALHRLDARALAVRLHAVYPAAHFGVVSRHQLLVSATSADLQQIQSLVSALDASPATPAPALSPATTEAVRIFQARVKDVAREVAGAVHGLRVSVAGQSVVLTGSPDAVSHAKDLLAVLDAPPAGTPYTAVYRIHTLDAQSVADLIARSYPDVKVTADEDINSLSVYATSSEQRRIADGIAQLDAPAMQAAGGQAVQGGGGDVDVYTLRAALPSSTGGQSTSAGDLATTVTQALAPQAPDLHISVSQETPQLILTGNPYSIKLAKDLLAQLDTPQPLVVLDTEILEVDENTAKNLGLSLSSINGGDFSIGTIIGESTPPPDPNTGLTPPVMRPQKLIRTPISFGFAINLAIAHGSARVLADPRITTLSGHTATIRAGDNLSIQLQAGGGAGTIATTQIQTFQTGVTLDITPIVNQDGLITVALHPVVNSLTGILNGIPQISTRDTQTTVALRANQTLVIGGLIQDNTQRTESKIPLLGDLPLVGPIFRNNTLNGTSNELIITVTPHVVTPGEPDGVYPGPPLPAMPTPRALPTLPPGTVLPHGTPTPFPWMPVQHPNGAPAKHPALRPPQNEILVPPVPSPVPSAFAQTNVFTFGSPPPNNYATPADAVQIFFATLSPTVLSYGTPVTVNAVTTSNVTQLVLSYNGVSTSLRQTGSGQWSSTFPFTLVGLPVPNATIQLTLTASKSDGTSSVIPIPVSVVARTSTATSAQRRR